MTTTRTTTRRILDRLVEDGAPLTAEEIAAKLEIPISTARSCVAELRRHGFVESRPATYAITQDGHRKQQWKPKTQPEEISMRVEKRRAKRENIGILEQARTVPNSVFALGGM